jgi:hypothetical protein
MVMVVFSWFDPDCGPLGLNRRTRSLQGSYGDAGARLRKKNEPRAAVSP